MTLIAIGIIALLCVGLVAWFAVTAARANKG